jgi:Holliday junction DNA helicase RuvA
MEMIAFVKGSLEESGDDYVIIDNNGIGYFISMTSAEIEKLKKTKENIKIYTYHYVREDQVGLFGFLDRETLNMFKLLISVSGIGPKAGMSILSSISPENMILAIITGDEKALCKASGVGKKLAQRIILELKDKFKNHDFIQDKGETGIDDTGSLEAVGALIALGYSKIEAESAISRVSSNLSVEDTIKQALKQLMRG